MFGVTVASYHKPVTAINVYFALKKKTQLIKQLQGSKPCVLKLKQVIKSSKLSKGTPIDCILKGTTLYLIYL